MLCLLADLPCFLSVSGKINGSWEVRRSALFVTCSTACLMACSSSEALLTPLRLRRLRSRETPSNSAVSFSSFLSRWPSRFWKTYDS